MGHLTEGEIAAFCKAWCEAEDSLKPVEAELIELPQQPINELRYATRHFARAVGAEDLATAREQYAAAIRHCTCAGYDTAEAVLLFRCLRFKAFQEEFSDFPIETPVLDYGAAQLAYQAAQDAISRDPDNRHHRKAAVQQACESLTKFDKSLDTARNELNKKRDRAPQTEKGTARRFRSQIAVALFAALFGGGCTLGAKIWLDRHAAAASGTSVNLSALKPTPALPSAHP